MNKAEIRQKIEAIKEHIERFPHQYVPATPSRPFLPGLCRRYGDDAPIQGEWVAELKRMVDEIEI